jgi:hypothetical protein
MLSCGWQAAVGAQCFHLARITEMRTLLMAAECLLFCMSFRTKHMVTSWFQSWPTEASCSPAQVPVRLRYALRRDPSQEKSPGRGIDSRRARIVIDRSLGWASPPNSGREIRLKAERAWRQLRTGGWRVDSAVWCECARHATDVQAWNRCPGMLVRATSRWMLKRLCGTSIWAEAVNASLELE